MRSFQFNLGPNILTGPLTIYHLLRESQVILGSHVKIDTIQNVALPTIHVKGNKYEDPYRYPRYTANEVLPQWILFTFGAGQTATCSHLAGVAFPPLPAYCVYS